MSDIEKVIKGLECCFRGNDCRNCPYKEVFNPERPNLDCIDMTREDAIALLKEYRGAKPLIDEISNQVHDCAKMFRRDNV